MKNRIYTGIGIVLVIIAIAKIYDREVISQSSEDKILGGHKPQKIEFFNKKEVTETAVPVSKTLVHVRHPSSSDKGKKSNVEILDSFSKSEIEFFDNKYSLVEGLYASVEPIPGQKEILQLGGFYVYDSKTDGGLHVFYSSAKGKYGVFTGEIKINGGTTQTISLLEAKSFEIVFRSDLTQQLVFKIENVKDLSALDSLNDDPNLKVEPDLKFARAKKM